MRYSSIKYFLIHITAGLVLLLHPSLTAQQTYCYPLTSTLSGTVPDSPDLEVLPNGSGQTGSFVTVPAPPNLCPGESPIQAWHFNDNAGLAFDNSSNFIGCEYSIEFLFRIEELPGLFDPPWMWLMGFKENEDDGIFLYQTPFLGGVSLQFWNDNTQLFGSPAIATINGFNTNNWNKITIVRSCTGMVSVYINCQLLVTFNDAIPQILLPSPSTGNQIIFFQDDANILSSEAAPGFVRNINVSNYAFSSTQIAASCDCLCEALSEDCVSETTVSLLTCDPDAVGMVSDTFNTTNLLCGCSCDSIVTTITTLTPSGAVDTTFTTGVVCQASLAGTFCQTLTTASNCDSIVCQILTFTPIDTTFTAGVVCQASLAGTFCQTLMAASNCDSVVCQVLTFTPIDTTFTTGVVCQASQAGTFCQTLTTASNCDSVVCQILTFTPIDTTFTPGVVCEASLAGTFCQTLMAASNCDSVVCQVLTFTPIDTTFTTGVVCQASQAGTFCQTLTTASNCDSVVCQILTFTPIDTTFTPGVVCEASLAGTFCQTLMAASNCDSVVCQILTFTPIDTTFTTGVVCQPSQAGTFCQTLTTASNCDSVICQVLIFSPIDTTFTAGVVCEASLAGTFCQTLMAASNCDSVVCQELILITPEIFTYETTTCNPLETGSDTLFFGCDSILIFNTILEEFSIFALPNDTTLQAGEALQISLITNPPDLIPASVEWTPNIGLSCDSCMTVLANPEQNMTYQVLVTSSNGCIATTSVNIGITRSERVYVPSGFSPNGDNVNDRFILYGGNDVLEIEVLKIFDRWGNVVFDEINLQPNDYSNGWDGLYKGKMAGAGVYVWLAQIKIKNGAPVKLTGSITLVR